MYQRKNRNHNVLQEISTNYSMSEQSISEYIALMRWNNAIYCPHCKKHNVYVGMDEKRPYKCRNCNLRFSVKTGTIMQHGNISIHKWVYLMYEIFSNKKEISLYKISSKLELSQNSVLHMTQKITSCFDASSSSIKQQDDDIIIVPIENIPNDVNFDDFVHSVVTYNSQIHTYPNKQKILNVISGSKKTILTLGEIELECYILEDETRVFTTRDMHNALKIPKNASTTALQKILAHENIAPYIDFSIREKLHERKEFYRTNDGRKQSIAQGYEATLLIDICTLVVQLASKDSDLLTLALKRCLSNAQSILVSVSNVGIIDLIDEITQYAPNNNYEALKVLLKKYIDPNLQVLIDQFPNQFFYELYTLYKGDTTKSNNKPLYFAHFINTYIFKPLEKGHINSELKSKKSQLIANKKHTFYDWLLHKGADQFVLQLGKIIATMQISNNIKEFNILFKKYHHCYLPDFI